MKIFLTSFIVSLILSACGNTQSFVYRDIRNFKIDSIGSDHSTVSMDLIYFNPNSFGVYLKKIDCDVYVDHNYVGKYSLDTLMRISRQSEFSIPSRMLLNTKSIFRNAFTTLLSGDLFVEIKGTARVGKVGVFITVPFNYSGRQKLSLF